MKSSTPQAIYRKDYVPSDFLIETAHLHVDLHDDETRVKSVLTLKRNVQANTPEAPLVLDGEAMDLQAVVLDGAPLTAEQYQLTAEYLTIKAVPDSFVLETEVILKPQENTTLMGLYQSRGNYCTQCESHGFRRITYYLDRPDVLARFTTTITADKTRYPLLLSNGNCVETKALSDNRHEVRWEDPTLKPCYLFALVAGDFDVLEDEFTTMSEREVSLRLYVEKGFLEQADYAMEALKRSMRWDEETFGCEYDLDIYMIVAVSDFNMGAMENKGLNVFNTKYVLAKPETATDKDYVDIEAVIGHEYFHNWSGNRVTCQDWFQLTLKEGLTVLRDQLFTEDMTSKAVARLNTANVVRHQQFAEDGGAMAHPIRPDSYIEMNNFYTLTVYRKGAEVIRMLRTLLGVDTFRKAMDVYFSRHDGQAVTTEAFVKVMEDVSGKDLTQFRRWYSQAGTPQLDLRGQYDAAQKRFTLTVKQSCPATPGQSHKEPFHLPLSMGLLSQAGEDLPTQLVGEASAKQGERILEIREPEQTFQFVGVNERPVPSLLRGFSAPVKWDYPYTDEELLVLLRSDNDAFSRFEAGQAFSMRLIFTLLNAHQKNKPLNMDSRLVDVFKELLLQEGEDRQFIAALLLLPDVSYLAQQMPVADIEGLYVVIQFVRQALATALAPVFLRVYQSNQLAAYRYDMEDVGKRALKNVCLDYLVHTDLEEYQRLAYQQFSESDNMTDKMGALAALNHQTSELRERALSEFYAQYQHEPLVVNKWLALHAASTLPDTLERLDALMQHEAYDMSNPNNVYAVWVTLGANVMHLHRADGSGYRVLADQVLALDSINAQVAARVLQPLTRWSNVDDARKQHIQRALQRIVDTKGVSNDVYELASKSIL